MTGRDATAARRRFAPGPTRALGLAAVALLAGACATAQPAPTAPQPAPRVDAPPPPRPVEAPMPEMFESERFILAFARAGDTAAALATRHLGDAGKAWLIEDYNGAASFAAGQEVTIPKRDWNPSGVDHTGYQIVPILVYHNLAPEAKGRMVLAAKSFEEQMRYLKAQGYRVISLRDFIEFGRLGRQLPRRSVVLTFDDGYKAFKTYAHAILKELGFTATLFVYTDYVGAGRNSLSWPELRELAGEGFDIQAHSKTHGDLRRTTGETDAAFARRMQAELEGPRGLFQRNLGAPPTTLAYPYGAADEDVVRAVRETGYAAAFTVRREGNPSFVTPLRAHRSQIYSEMSLQDFIKNLEVRHEEKLGEPQP
jgi:peptidoglycan/xylan/chitin deacetylase (PgdA/CDA1 family)